MGKSAEFAEIASVFQRHSRFLLACHERADGDALGSLLGLGLSLRSLGKSSIMYSPGGVPGTYRFVAHREEIVGSLEGVSPEEVEVVVCLDCDGLPRAGELSDWLGRQGLPVAGCGKERLRRAGGQRPLIVDIDHHEPERGFGDVRLIAPQAAATAILVHGILVEMEAAISPEVATHLLMGIYLDTGSLRYDNTNEEVFCIAGELTALGADPAFVARGLYETKTLPALHLLGRALSGANLAAGGELIFARLTQGDFEEAAATREETEGIIDLLRADRGSSVAALFIQYDGQEVKVSLRSKGRIDVAAIASRHGGGGHARAAGFTLPGPLKESVPAVIDEIEQLLRQSARLS